MNIYVISRMCFLGFLLLIIMTEIITIHYKLKADTENVHRRQAKNKLVLLLKQHQVNFFWKINKENSI